MLQTTKAVLLLQSACRGHQCVTRHNKTLWAIQGPLSHHSWGHPGSVMLAMRAVKAEICVLNLKMCVICRKWNKELESHQCLLQCNLGEANKLNVHFSTSQWVNKKKYVIAHYGQEGEALLNIMFCRWSRRGVYHHMAW